MEFTDRTITATPTRPAALVRISEDPLNLERGIKRQTDDVRQKQRTLGWQGTLQMITENDTSAYKRRRVTLPDGTRALRVVRPEFDALIAAIYAGTVDGLIVYDLDRLVRQPRQLEDLIEAVETMRIPVHSVSAGEINLLTPDGRTLARVMCTMALKASEDTSRRVGRAAFQAAKDGTATRGGHRRYGWEADGLTLVETEAIVLREIVARVMRGESITSICTWLNDSGIPTVNPQNRATKASGKWLRGSVMQMLRNPRLAGIRPYVGVGRGRTIGPNDWRNRAATKDGKYVMGPWTPVITVDLWEAMQHVLDAPQGNRARSAAAGAVGGGHNARKYLLTGFLRCGNANCGARMNGKPATKHRKSAYYQCLPKDQGGCGGTRRDMEKVDELVGELLMRHLEERATTGVAPDLGGEQERAEADAAIKRLTASKAAARSRWQKGEYASDADYYADLDALSEELDAWKAKATLRATPKRIIANPRKEWAEGSLSLKRAFLAQELIAITIMPQAKPGRYGWNPSEIVPSWR